MVASWLDRAGRQYGVLCHRLSDEQRARRGGVDDERRSKWETCSIAANDLAVTEAFKVFASDSRRMIQRGMLKDSGRQFGDRLGRATRGQFRAVTLADWFEIGVDISLLSEVFECVRISDAQPETDFDVFKKVDSV
ncbi:hypothetical protein C451_04114 [Halococcus thailandensis JCM 13552]|uniref:Uncharacterized protein n=2 Tax=Halococcus thailandensis TaxID=335952 RepID=M0NDS1_9EURY|nr:hypothetical protein C451_04114 [Halococcus thailandensis JCM 13552]